jgi:hypothetical protein
MIANSIVEYFLEFWLFSPNTPFTDIFMMNFL